MKRAMLFLHAKGLPGRSRSPLSKREIEVLQLVAMGCNSAAIAEVLYIAEATVRTHVNNIFKKLDVHSRAEAVAHAMRAGLIELD